MRSVDCGAGVPPARAEKKGAAMKELNHTSVPVADVGRSRQFYEGILGLSPVARPDFGFPGVWYGLGHGQLHLIQRQMQREHVTPKIDPTDPHFAITVDDMDAVRKTLRTAGIEMLDF